MKSYKFLFLLLIVLCVFLFYYFKIRHINVEVVTPFRGLAVDAVYATGVIESKVMYPVSSEISARLIQLNVDEGAEVKKGQLLAQLEGAEYIELVNQLKAQEEFAESIYQKFQKLKLNNAVSEDELNKAKADWLAAKSATLSAVSRAEYSKLEALRSGTIIKRDGEVGQLIPANQPVFWISESDELRISAEIDEEDIPKIRVGQEVKIQSDAFLDKNFNGIVSQITAMGDPITRSFRVRIDFKEEHAPLMIGMTVELNIIVETKPQALLIPSKAIENDIVWLVDSSNRLVKREVKLGILDSTNSEVLSGINKNSKIIKSPLKDFKEGQKIRIKNES